MLIAADSGHSYVRRDVTSRQSYRQMLRLGRKSRPQSLCSPIYRYYSQLNKLLDWQHTCL